jgi:predicted DNA repair protein MutK
VYGFVAGIVKLDDLGLWLSTRATAAARTIGAGILRAAPWLMKLLSIAGTAAMFLVGGGILVHGVPPLHHAIAHAVEGLGGPAQALLPTLADGLIGMLAGAVVLAAVSMVKRWRSSPSAAR